MTKQFKVVSPKGRRIFSEDFKTRSQAKLAIMDAVFGASTRRRKQLSGSYRSVQSYMKAKIKPVPKRK